MNSESYLLTHHLVDDSLFSDKMTSLYRLSTTEESRLTNYIDTIDEKKYHTPPIHTLETHESTLKRHHRPVTEIVCNTEKYNPLRMKLSENKLYHTYSKEHEMSNLNFQKRHDIGKNISSRILNEIISGYAQTDVFDADPLDGMNPIPHSVDIQPASISDQLGMEQESPLTAILAPVGSIDEPTPIYDTLTREHAE